MSAGSRCWMRWMWYGYIPSVCSVHQTLMGGTQMRAEILLVLVRRLRCTTSIMFSSSSIFHCIWLSAQRFTLEEDPFFADVGEHNWTNVCQGFVVENIVADIFRQQQWRYICKPRTQNAYRRILHRKMTCLHLLLCLLSEALLAL